MISARSRCMVTIGITFVLLLVGCGPSAPGGPPVMVGLIAPMTGGLAVSGAAIQRGMLLAMDEVNQDGGVLGRPLQLAVRDVQNDPQAGVAALRGLVEQEGIVAVFGGIFSPVMIGQLDAVHQLEIPLINPWGSVTSITKNGRDPNYAFRVSLSDDSADEFLVRYALEVLGIQRPGIIADITSWGDSNIAGLSDWLARLDTEPAGIERFEQGDNNMNAQLARLRDAGADSLLMVANAPEGAAIVRGMATFGWKVPVIGHWGISGGRFVELAGVENSEGVFTVQTYSFFGPLSQGGEEVLQAYHDRYDTRRTEDVLAPVGVVHGYDGVHLLARAIQKAGTVEGPAIRDALENLDPYDGVVKRYSPAFTRERHDALAASDYIMAVWKDNRLIPAPQARLNR